MSTPDYHLLVVEDSDMNDTIFACINCSRRVLIHRQTSGEYVVLAQGDIWALHSGVAGPFSITVSAVQGDS